METLDLKTYLDKVKQLNEEAKKLKKKYQEDIKAILIQTLEIDKQVLEVLSSELSNRCVYKNHINIDIMIEINNMNKEHHMLTSRLSIYQKNQLETVYEKMKESCNIIAEQFYNIQSVEPFTDPQLLSKYAKGSYKKDLLNII